MKIIVGSRGSSLALKQTEYVKNSKGHIQKMNTKLKSFIPLVIKCNILLWTK